MDLTSYVCRSGPLTYESDRHRRLRTSDLRRPVRWSFDHRSRSIEPRVASTTRSGPDSQQDPKTPWAMPTGVAHHLDSSGHVVRIDRFLVMPFQVAHHEQG